MLQGSANWKKKKQERKTKPAATITQPATDTQHHNSHLNDDTLLSLIPYPSSPLSLKQNYQTHP